MEVDRLMKKRIGDLTENMAECRLNKKRRGDTIDNMDEYRLKKKRAGNQTVNMSSIRLEKLRKSQLVESMCEERVIAIREARRSKIHSAEMPSIDASTYENVENFNITRSAYIPIENGSRIIRASYNQANEEVFRSGFAGVQCCAMVLANIIKATILPPCKWTTDTLNMNMLEGDECYKAIKIISEEFQSNNKIKDDGFLAVNNFDVIKNNVTMFNETFTIKYDSDPSLYGSLQYIFNIDPAKTLLQALTLLFQEHSAGILITEGKSLGVMYYDSKYYYTDSHSCGPEGASAANGRACVIECDNIHELDRICKRSTTQNNTPYTLDYIEVHAKHIVCPDQPPQVDSETLMAGKNIAKRNAKALSRLEVRRDSAFERAKESEITEETEEQNRKHVKLSDKKVECKDVSKKKKKKKNLEFTGDISLGAHLNVKKYVLGELNVKCKNCGAVRFAEQKGRTVNSCCHNGKVQVPPLKEYPPLLNQLLTADTEDAKHFRNHIRAYNSTFAFATFGARVEDSQGRGPPLIKIQGQVYHHATSSLDNMGTNSPRNGQIYIYDNVEEASKMRIQLEHPDLNYQLETLLRQINPYAQKYKMLQDMTVSGEEFELNFVKYAFDDKRRYNEPTSSEVAIIIVSKDGCVDCVDLKVYPKQEDGRETTILNQTSQHADPMTFPLLFPKGDLGWTYNMSMEGGKKISPVQYYGHRLALRPDETFNPLLNAGRLTQQYVINCYILVESQRLDYIRHNQSSLRTECYQGIVDHVENNRLNEASKVRLGTAVILPATYIGSPRCLQQLYQDSMAICRKVGRPDYFITITCNPRWTKITTTLKRFFVKNTTANDIPTIVTDIFQMKVNELIKDLVERQVLGPIVAYVYTIEFQKRGLPHAHILAALRPDCKLLAPEDVDRYISAELSNEDSSLRYYQLRHMMHGPHRDGLLCWDSDKKICSKNFPKEFCKETDMTGDGFLKYRRRDNIDKCYSYHSKVNGKVEYVDNRMVVPHNPYLLKKFDCHLNVEYCSSVMAVKYIHKYIHKGHDRARMELKQHETDEVERYIDSRYISAMEAAWRLNEIPLHKKSHTVVRLPVHLNGQQYVTFKEGHEETAKNKESTTMLLAWFELNKQNKEANSILYGNLPESYSWNGAMTKWIPRKKAAKVIGRIVNVSPRDAERFHLKLILNRIPGAKGYEDLRTHEEIVYGTYREAAIAMGITENSEEANAVLQEAATTLMPYQLRRFFVYYLIGDEPSDALQLWEKFKEQMTEKNGTSYDALCQIEAQLNAENRTCKAFGLPEPTEFQVAVQHTDIEYHTDTCKKIEEKFNSDQKTVYDRIIHCISDGSKDCPRCFFIDGPGGTGKTFVYNGIYHRLQTVGKKVACVAWTGIASILLPSGTTSHRLFNLPIELTEEGICLLKTRDKIRLQELDVVIWDEASMIPRKALETIDRTLRDVMNNQLPFGGKTFVLGGDFRQLLPVVKKASRSQIVDGCIKSSHLWSIFEIHRLNINMRAVEGGADFADWLLQCGNGNPNPLVVESASEWACEDLVDWFFQDVSDAASQLVSRIILSPQNDEVNRINEKILSRIDGEEIVSYSIDKATLSGIDKSDAREEEATLRYSDEYLNSITPSGIPPHKLKLKKGCIVMLIRNLSIVDGLCNGTRLLVLQIGCRILRVKIITGDCKGTVVNIPRIQLNTSSGHSQLPFVLYRRQFPVRLAYALTINKSQGQTFQRVGLFIERPIFAHGQLYVALSRCVSDKQIKIMVKDGNSVDNIVYQEVLS